MLESTISNDKGQLFTNVFDLFRTAEEFENKVWASFEKNFRLCHDTAISIAIIRNSQVKNGNMGDILQGTAPIVLAIFGVPGFGKLFLSGEHHANQFRSQMENKPKHMDYMLLSDMATDAKKNQAINMYRRVLAEWVIIILSHWLKMRRLAYDFIVWLILKTPHRTMVLTAKQVAATMAEEYTTYLDGGAVDPEKFRMILGAKLLNLTELYATPILCSDILLRLIFLSPQQQMKHGACEDKTLSLVARAMPRADWDAPPDDDYSEENPLQVMFATFARGSTSRHSGTGRGAASLPFTPHGAAARSREAHQAMDAAGPSKHTPPATTTGVDATARGAEQQYGGECRGGRSDRQGGGQMPARWRAGVRTSGWTDLMSRPLSSRD